MTLTIRSARPGDLPEISYFLNRQSRVHRHMDWRSALDWLSSQPYLLATQHGDIQAIFACPPDPANVAWVRLFAVSDDEEDAAGIWQLLLGESRRQIPPSSQCQLASLTMADWYTDLLEGSGFTTPQEIVVLDWERNLPPPVATSSAVTIRHMEPSDLTEVIQVDNLAFAPLWQISRESLTLAYRQSSISTVAIIKNQIIGYQISTASADNGHLARLAIHPYAQRHHIAYALVRDMFTHFLRMGMPRVSVNTQGDNSASLALYQKLGFVLTGDRFPVYLWPSSKT